MYQGFTRILLAQSPAALLTVALIMPATSASAACFSQEQGVFWGNRNGGTWNTATSGTDSFNRITGRSIDSNCNIVYQTGSTAHFRLSTVAFDFVEIGWLKKNDQTYVVFTEWAIGNIPLNGTPHFFSFSPCPVVVGDFHNWRVVWDFSNSDWVMHRKCPGDSSYRQVDRWTDPPDSNGLPVVETLRKASGNGMSDHHHDLKWRGGTTWNSWSDMACLFDNATDWNGREVAGNHYETQQAAGGCGQ